MPVSRRELVQKMKRLGFDGPLAGGKHQFMHRGKLKVAIPNEHRGDLSDPLLARILQRAGITASEWDGA